uniref:Uncharacterized protein n=1 Tax=Trypanosoma vivax (strain Y486) TaxID=1055687 RepID=G0TXV8_TRYVY|nr:conserved hypothetical protein [Trypanosoma vivax Y486]
MFVHSEVEQLAPIELDAQTVESYLATRAVEENSKRMGSCRLEDEGVVINTQPAGAASNSSMQVLCDSFVQAFLTDDGVATLHCLLRECDASLNDIAGVLCRFIQSLETTQEEFNDVRRRLCRVTMQLHNTVGAERLLHNAASRFVVPPELVQIIVHGSEEELGQQFKHCTQQLLRYLRHFTKEANLALMSGSRDRAKSVGVDTGCSENEGDVPNVRFTEYKMYAQHRELLSRLTVRACMKAKRFLSKKIASLGVKKTNVSIQQEHVIKPHAFYAHLLHEAKTLLRPLIVSRTSNTLHNVTGGSSGMDRDSPEVLPYRIVRALHDELRSEYCDIMSKLYFERIRHYLMTLNSMEGSTQTAPKGISAWGKPDATPWVTLLPLLTEEEDSKSPSYFELGERAAILSAVFSPPLVPTVERAKWRLHTFEETFRSLNMLLCDAVTHEFLFTFMFFSGDMSVCVDVFKPTVQFIVNYVSEVLLGQGNNSSSGIWRTVRDQYPKASLNTTCRNDCYGLLLLIRLCNDFSSLMKDSRRLRCLEQFYDSLLLLLWPAFQQTFERQMRAIRSCDVLSLARAVMRLASTQGITEWAKCVHPMAKRYAAFSTALVTIISGCGFSVAVDAGAEANSASADEDGRRERVGNVAGECDQGEGLESKNETSNASEENMSFSELQRLAWRAIEAERASDKAGSAARFAVLASNLSFMQLEMVRVLKGIGAHLAGASRCEEQPRSLAFLLNNLHYITTTWHLTVRNGDTSIFGEDFITLSEIEASVQNEFVQMVLREHFSQMHRAVRLGMANEVLPAASAFRERWRSCLDDASRTVADLVLSESHRDDVLAQFCKELLLCNTQFHSCVSKALGEGLDSAGRSVRTLIVTNEHLLQHMRTLAAISKDEDADL